MHLNIFYIYTLFSLIFLVFPSLRYSNLFQFGLGNLLAHDFMACPHRQFRFEITAASIDIITAIAYMLSNSETQLRRLCKLQFYS